MTLDKNNICFLYKFGCGLGGIVYASAIRIVSNIILYTGTKIVFHTITTLSQRHLGTTKSNARVNNDLCFSASTRSSG
jgi:hypothetical protein